ncbi:MAG: GerMN domain-containing protein, partial [Vallitaleaceae bacterium]|nr:GerMN domain-containing protein [Vallitaleaceae bacterium]
NGGTTMIHLLEIEDGELRSFHSEGEFYHVEDRLSQFSSSEMLSDEAFNNLPETPLDILLKEPIEVGTTWQSAYGNERSITALDKTIQVPYGEFQALEVTTLLDDNTEQYDYYVKDLGFVLSIYQASDFEVKTLLKEVKKDHALTLPLQVYYPDFEGETTAYSEESIEFYTNDSIVELLANKMKTVSGTDDMPTLTENVHLNSLQTDPNLGILYIDFSNNLVREMNAGSLLEGLILQSINNTLGNYTHLNKVVITLDGELYSSGHFMLEQGDYFEVQFGN